MSEINLPVGITAAIEHMNQDPKALCNHFDRKATASYDDHNGRIWFAFGECTLQTSDEALLIRVVAESDTMFTRVKHVVADHLVRFGNKEELLVNWVDTVPAV